MGEPLYEEVVGRDKLDRPCRVYAPVGSHETLLAYLVRRLLENGANTSFVNRIADASVPIDDLVADPVAAARAIQPLGAPHEQIAAPRDLYGAGAGELARARSLRASSVSPSLPTALERERANALARRSARRARRRAGEPVTQSRRSRRRRRRARHRARPTRSTTALAPRARRAAPAWAPRARQRARGACCAAPPTRCEARSDALIGLIVREAGKSYANAVAEVREAVDFLRYYARRGGAHARSGRARAARAWSSASARGIFRSPSSPARSPPRSPRAMPCSPSPPRRRR